MKLKRIFALIGVILLLLMYLCTLIFSLMTGEVAGDLFKASIFATLIIPVFLYVYGMFYRYYQHRGQEIREAQKENKENDDLQ